MKCENPDCKENGTEIHHIYFKSQYRMDDRNELWNLSLLCLRHHRGDKGIHNKGNPKLDRYLKNLADVWKPPAERSTVKFVDTYAKALRKKQYDKKIDAYRAMHGGLSPSQVAYRKKKAYLKSLKHNI